MAEEKKILNQEQLRAIKFGSGPLLVIAGAGTGKTTVITERIKYLITSEKVKPSEILALTFTEKAAQEMEERVDQIVPFGYTQMWISTFHSFGDRILRDEALHIGLDPHYVLLSEAESLLFLKSNLFKLKLDYFRPAGNPFKFLHGLLTHFSRLKDEDVSPQQYLAYVKKLSEKFRIQNLEFRIEKEEIKRTQELARVYQQYEELKTKNGLMDFGDLISQTLHLFRTRKNVLAEYRKKFKYLLVDEFQDTNIAQNELIMLLAGTGKKANLTVVADDDQSIYKWRGAAISNVLQFRKNYPQTKIITLTTNYRSTQEILNRAYDLIQYNNPDRLEVQEKINKKLVASKNIVGEKIKFFYGNRVENEADLVAQEIKKLTQANKRPGLTERPGLYKYEYSDIAILLRANNHAEPFTRALLRLGIPFQFLGPGRLLRQEEVKDLIAYLRVLYNFEDNVAFFRVLSLPILQISPRDIATLRSYSKKYNLSLFEAAEAVDKLRVTESGKTNIQKLVKIIHKHLKLMPTQSAGQILYYFLEDTGMLKLISQFKTAKEEQVALNLAKFFDQLKHFEAEHVEAGVEAVVDWLNLKMEMGESPLASQDDWSKENKVNLLTIHSSKGLEFPIVFLVNLVNDRFPTRVRKEQIPIPDELIKEVLPQGDPHLEEERRLFYVGLTRAQEKIYFSAAKFYAQAQRIKKLSPFVMETLGKQLTELTIKSTESQLSIFDFRPPQPKTLTISNSKTLTFLSYSQIETFNRCPLLYKFRYILKIPAPPAAAASFGTSLHLALKDFYQQIVAGITPTQKDLEDYLKTNWVKRRLFLKKT